MSIQPSISDVVFKEIQGFSGCYLAGTDGSIWGHWGKGLRCNPELLSNRPWKKLSPISDKEGYVYVVLYDRPGHRIRRRVHQLILEVFVSERPDGMITRHLNGVRSDNRLENLAWGTPKENSQDMVGHGHSQRGETNSKAVLSDEDAIKIVGMLDAGVTGVKIAEAMGISASVIAGINTGRNRNWLTNRTASPRKRQGRRLAWNGETKPMPEWAEILGIPSATISARLKYGWSVEQALSIPVGATKNQRPTHF